MKLLLYLLFTLSLVNAQAQLKHSLQNTRSSNQGRTNIYGIANSLGNRNNPYVEQTGRLYLSFGFEIQDINYDRLGLRFKFNSDLLTDIIYYVVSWAAGVPNSLDEQYSNSAFNGGILEWMTTINLFTRDKVNVGGGFVLYDMVHTVFDPVRRPSRPDGGPDRAYAALFGPAINADFFIAPTFTLHTDVYRGFPFYHSLNEDLVENGFERNPFSSWKATALLLHNSTGLFLAFRHHQAIPKGNIGLPGSRSQILFGLRLNMGRFNGESYKDDPRRRPNKETF